MNITITARNNASIDNVLDGIVTTILRDRAELSASGGFIQGLNGSVVAEYNVSL